MSKKLLNESTIRRFGQLANMNSSLVSNFIQEMVEEETPPYIGEEEEEDGDLGLDGEVDMELPPEEPVMDYPEDEALGEEPADLASKVIQAVADALDIQVDIVGGAADDLGLEDDLAADDLGLEDDLEESDVGQKSFDALVAAVLQEIENVKSTDETEITEAEEADETEITEADEADKAEIDEEVVQEVLRRVKSRIASLRNKKS